MKTDYSSIAIRGIFALVIGAGLVHTACADEREHDRDRHEHGGHEAAERYHTEHWVYDDRHNHAHYYPSPGYRVGVLPGNYLALGLGNRRFFFQAGVWYEPVRGGYAVARPPIGIMVPVLPPDYATLWVGGVPYYYANDIYYAATPGGYVVVNPPTVGSYVEAPPPAATPSPPPPAPTAPPASGAMWYYCVSSNAYYPYVATCSEGWKPVPAIAPPNH